MKTEFRNRAFLPVVMPLAILAVIGAVVGVVALTLLYIDRQGAVALAIAGAAGILVAVSLAASQDKLELPHRGVIGLAALAPLVVGGLVAVGAVGGLSDEDRNINVEPHQVQFEFPGLIEDAPVLTAESATTFCLDEGGDCQDTREWSFTYQEAERIAYAFDNRDSVAHNLFIYAVPEDELPSTSGNPIPLSDLQENFQPITPGPPSNIDPGGQASYEWTPPGGEGEAGGDETAAIPETAYFVCTLHAGSMWGIVEITPEG